MKLAFCLFKYFPFGGLQRDFMRIAKECVKRGHSVDVYTMEWDGELDLALPVHIISPKSRQNHTRSQHFAAQLKKEFANKHYDLIVGFNKMPGLDVYYAADTCFRAKYSAWHKLLPRHRHWMAYENAVFAKEKNTQILTISKSEQDKFLQYYQTDASRLHLLPPGIAKDRIAPLDAANQRETKRRELHLKDDELLLLLVGSGFKTKGLDRILQGIAALPDTLKNRTTLYVVGDDHAAHFKKQANRLNLQRIYFLGGRDDVPRLLLAADLLVHPSYYESAGMVLLEAMVSGLPVLTTDVCGYAHYVSSANAGIVLPSPFKQTDFNHALQNMLTSENRTTWRQNGITFGQTADIYNMPQHAVDIIESLKQTNFKSMMTLRGHVFRELENRRTQQIELDGQSYFLKQHFGVGWKEIFKNLLQLKLPVVSAKNEFRSLKRLHELNIPAPEIVGYECRGINPAKRQSYIMTRALPPHISLEDFCKERIDFRLKQKLITEVARIARTLHEHGMNHRDFYICHFLLDKKLKLYLIDLHRGQIRKTTPERWIIKDLAALYFSSKDTGLTQRDLLRFIKQYRNQHLDLILTKETAFWQRVKQRGDKLYQQHTK
jgi:UDP-glucose:(heptosyl)LPS alpha-1,3-glucosyltransferase